MDGLTETIQAGGPDPQQALERLIIDLVPNGILLVAPDGLIVLANKHASTMFGYDCDIAASGSEAVEMVQHHSYPLILMDVQMPEMDGIRATAAIRALDQTLHTPIVAVTAGALVGDRERCLAGGMDDYISKPYWPKELEAVLDRWIAKGA